MTAISLPNRLPSSNISTRRIPSRRCCRPIRSRAPRSARFADLIACDIHPLNNLIALQYLRRELKHEQPAIDAWYHHWILQGFAALEAMLRPGPYSFGRQVTLADVCLVPQVYNARRLKVPLDKFPKSSRSTPPA